MPEGIWRWVVRLMKFSGLAFAKLQTPFTPATGLLSGYMRVSILFYWHLPPGTVVSYVEQSVISAIPYFRTSTSHPPY